MIQLGRTVRYLVVFVWTLFLCGVVVIGALALVDSMVTPDDARACFETVGGCRP